MSEPAPEPTPEPVTEPVEPSEPEPSPEPTPEPVEPGEPAQEPGEGAEGEEGAPAPPEAQHARSEKEIDVLYAKMASERARHFDRVAAIVGDDYEHLAPCPLCSHFGAGLVGLVDLPPEALPTLRGLLGMPDLSTFKEAEDARLCPRCDGKGKVLTGSLVPGYETKTCGGCNGIGWVGEGAAQQNGEPPPLDTAIVTGPTAVGPDVDDPDAARLRAKGWTAIPPMAPLSSSGS